MNELFRKCGLAEVKTDTCGEGLYSRFCEGSSSTTVDTGKFLSQGGGTSRKRSAAQEGRVQDSSWTLGPERSLSAPRSVDSGASTSREREGETEREEDRERKRECTMC
ncbi:hypothetical protein PHYPO_G00215090 [Pangasianodon hypophthalmus]|uniref:Uncharacterized protein n=1 Tax=Pangasianodon hypophthalmus TaxID=310915 RepID=A0A5N5P579_PANHP|nr:hypothetical protein PHYPO_G00215090 [Pangasianodon hypophthalmus]